MLVDGDDVAGVVPAVRWGFEDARIFGAVVAEHHVRSAHEEAASVVDAGNGIEARFHQRREAADAPRLVGKRCIDCQHGRGLRHAVAFENAHAELFQVDLAGRFAHRLGTGENVAQRAEVIGMRHTRIAVEERVGAEHDRRVHAVNELGDGAIVKRRRIEIDTHPGDQRQHQPDGEPERVEHGQHVEQLVLRTEVDARGSLRGIGQHVAMGEHDALRHALGARREQDGGPVVGLARDQRLARVQQATDLVAPGDGRPDILEVDELHLFLDRRHEVRELALLNERT